MYRKIAAAAAILTAGLTVGAPAFALLTGPGANDRPHLSSATNEPGGGNGGGGGGGGGSRPTTVKPGDAPKPPSSNEPPKPPTGGAGNEPHPTTTTTAKPWSAPSAPGTEVHRDAETLSLACTGARVEGVGAVRCEWSASHATGFARYVLWRQDPGQSQSQRRVVFQTTDRSVLTFTDKPLEPGNHYYGLLALDGSSNGVGSGGPVSSTVPTAPAPTTTTTAPKPTTTSFGCTLQGQAVFCKWAASTSERFAGYRLYREVPGTPAQVRFTTSDRGVTSATDTDVQPGATYVYRIVTMGTDGNPIAYGGPVTITIPSSGTGDAPKP